MIKKPYPCLYPWIILTRDKKADVYQVTDLRQYRNFTVGSTIGDYAKKLTGRVDPYSISPDLSAEETDWILRKLKDSELIGDDPLQRSASAGQLQTEQEIERGIGLPEDFDKLADEMNDDQDEDGTDDKVVMHIRNSHFLMHLARGLHRITPFLCIPVLAAGILLACTPDGDSQWIWIGAGCGTMLQVLLWDIAGVLPNIFFGIPSIRIIWVKPIFLYPGTEVDVDDIPSWSSRLHFHLIYWEEAALIGGILLLISGAVGGNSLLYGMAWGMVVFSLLTGMIPDTVVSFVFSDLLEIPDLDQTAAEFWKSPSLRKKYRSQGLKGWLMIGVFLMVGLYRILYYIFLLVAAFIVFSLATN